MTTKEMIEVMQAYEDGKKIQVNSVIGWVDLDDGDEPSWSWGITKYRIKPEPTYRPYKDTDEMIEDFKNRFNVEVPPYAMPEIWVKNWNIRSFITDIMPNEVVIEGDAQNMKYLFLCYTYLDGSPCGMKETKDE